MKAIWNGEIIAESENTIEVENNHYFPKEDVKINFIEESDTHSVCPWKGEASYYNILVNGEKNKDAAWYYPEPFEKAKHITDRVAFWNGVEVVD